MKVAVGNYFACHPSFELDISIFINESQFLENFYPLFIVWQKFQVLIRDHFLELFDFLTDKVLLMEQSVLKVNKASTE